MDYISQPQLQILEDQIRLYGLLASSLRSKDSEEYKHLSTTGNLDTATDELRLGGYLARNATIILDRLSNPELESRKEQEYKELVSELHAIISASNSCYEALSGMLGTA